jgi:parallel beta-helix repeat protein
MDCYGIKLDSCNNTISCNIFTDNWCGLFLSNSSNNNTIKNNVFNGNFGEIGIYLLGSNNNIIKNNAFSHKWNPLYLSDSSCNNIIEENYIVDNTHGIWVDNGCLNNTIVGNKLINISCCVSICLGSSSNSNIIINNSINMYSDWGTGICLYSNDNIVIGNSISTCGDGIGLYDSTDNNILCNSIFNCKNHGIDSCSYPPMGEKKFNVHFIDLKFIDRIYNKITNYTRSCSDDNTIHHNNFVNNNPSAKDKCSNKWDNEYPSGGNYWDDYNGTDNDGDGIGDTPYPIPGGDNEDRFPLMEPWVYNLLPIAEFNWIPSFPNPEEEILFNASDSIDFNGYIALYKWDWDNDGIFDEYHSTPTANHTFEEIGYHLVTLFIKDNESEIDTITKKVRVGNQPPNKPIITGPDTGKPDNSYNFTFNATDSEGDNIRYIIEWGDNNSETTAYVASGTNVTLAHAWTVGTYILTVYAQDGYGAISDETNFTIIIKKIKSIQNTLFLQFLEWFPLINRLLQRLIQ